MKLRKTVIKNTVSLAIAFGAVYLFCIVFNTTCPIRYFTHFPCPGCGLTRAALSLLKLDIKSAVKYNPMIFYVPVLIAEFIFDGKLLKNNKADFSLMIAGIIGFAAVFVYRIVIYFKFGVINI